MWDVTVKRSKVKWSLRFLLTHPVWDVTFSAASMSPSAGFLLTHPVWDVTLLWMDYLTGTQ